jgi:hypothetical protein
MINLPSPRELWKLEFTAPPALRDVISDDLEVSTGGGTCLPAFGVWRNPSSGNIHEEPMDYWVTTSVWEEVIRKVVDQVQSRLRNHKEISSWHCVTKCVGGITIL